MDRIAEKLKAYIDMHPLDLGEGDCKIVLDQLYQAYAESHESDPAEISDSVKKLEEFLCTLPLEDNNAVFNLCCRLCSAYERKAFLDGVQYGVLLLMELKKQYKALMCTVAVYSTKLNKEGKQITVPMS